MSLYHGGSRLEFARVSLHLRWVTGVRALRARDLGIMRRLGLMLVCCGLGALSTAALAFQESKGGVAEGQQQQAAPQAGTKEQPLDLRDVGGDAIELRDTGVSVAPPAGVEVRIPGLGKLGVLPKFDFGLELLYGANDQKLQEMERQTAPGDDVQIRGSFKHRF